MRLAYLYFFVFCFFTCSNSTWAADIVESKQEKKIEIKLESNLNNEISKENQSTLSSTGNKSTDKTNIQKAKKRVKDREKKLQKIVERELEIAERTLRYSKNKGKISLRLLSSFSDKMRILRKNENKNYLANTDINIKKDTFFIGSTTLEKEARNSVVQYIEKNGEFKGIDRIYLTLALNSRDYGDNKHTLKFLKKARDNTKERDVRITIETILGDYYYNDKKFHLAIKYYKSILQDEKVEWWTKYAYNLAWCYLKRKKHVKALDLLKEVIRRSKKKQYIDYSKVALEKIGIFYVYAHKEQQGIDYLIKVTDQPAPYLKSMAIFLMSRENNIMAERVLKIAYKKGTRAQKGEVLLYLMQLYEKLRNNKKVFQMSEKMFANKLQTDLNEVQVGELEIYLKNLIVFHDERVNSGKRKIYDFEVITRTYEKLIALDIPYKSIFYYRLALLNDLYKFNTGAFKLGRKSLDSYTGKEEKLSKEDVYIFTIGQLNKICSRKKHKYTKCEVTKEKYYLEYLKDFPKGSLAEDTYIGLFNLSMKRKQFEQAEGFVDQYVSSFPDSRPRQQNLIKGLLKYYQKKKDINQLQRWQTKITSESLFDANSKDVTVLRNLIGGLAFENNIAVLKGGASLDAIPGFQKLYDDTRNTQDLRMKSALNIALTYYESKKSKQALIWIKKAIKLMSVKNLNQKRKQLLSLAQGFFSRGDLISTKEYSTILFKNLCGKVKGNLDTIYEKNILSLFYSGEEGEAFKLLGFNYPCLISNKVKNRLITSLISMSTEFSGLEGLEKLKEFVNKRTQKVFNQAVFDYYIHLSSWQKKKYWPRIEAIALTKKKPFSYFTKADSLQDDIDEFLTQQLAKELYTTSGKLDETKLDGLITKKLKKIDRFARRGRSIKRSRIPEVQFQVVGALSRVYKFMSEQLKTIKAFGMSDEYREAFEPQMRELSGQMRKESNTYLKIKRKLADTDVNTSKKDVDFSHVMSVFQKERLLRYDLP